MKQFFSSILLAGSMLSVITISEYVHRTNFCTEFDDGRVYRIIMHIQPTKSWKIGNLKGAIRTRRAGFDAKVSSCIRKYEDYNISETRDTIELPLGSSAL